MNQVIVDPNELKLFAKHLNSFKKNIEQNNNTINTQLSNLSDSWKDDEHRYFSDTFNEFLQSLKPFLGEVDNYSSFLTRKANSIHRAINIKDTDILDKISKIFNKSLEDMLLTIKNSNHKYSRAIDTIGEKIASLNSNLRSNEELLGQNKAKIQSLRMQQSNYTTSKWQAQSKLDSLSSSDLTDKVASARDSLINQINDYDFKIMRLNSQISDLNQKNNKYSHNIENFKESIDFTTNLKITAETLYEEYTILLSNTKIQADNILNDTFQKLNIIKNTIQEYKSVRSNGSGAISSMSSSLSSSSSSGTTSSTSTKKEIAKPKVAEEPIQIKPKVETISIIETDSLTIDDINYTISNKIKNNKITSSLSLNDNIEVTIKYKAIKNKPITILSINDTDKNYIKYLVQYIENLALSNQIPSIVGLIDEEYVLIFKELGFTTVGKQISKDGIEMTKTIKGA